MATPTPTRLAELAETYGVEYDGPGAASVELDVADAAGAFDLANDHGVTVTRYSGGDRPLADFHGRTHDIFSLLAAYDAEAF